MELASNIVFIFCLLVLLFLIRNKSLPSMNKIKTIAWLLIVGNLYELILSLASDIIIYELLNNSGVTSLKWMPVFYLPTVIFELIALILLLTLVRHWIKQNK